MLLTKPEVCELLRVSPATLQRLVANGDIPQYKVGRQCRYYEDEVKAFIKRSSMVLAAPRRPQNRKSGRPRTSGYIPGMKVV